MIPAMPNTFLDDVLRGLAAPAKHLSSKYFYDEVGDRLFQRIMRCPEYYLTDCELEILRTHPEAIVDRCLAPGTPLDIVELGPGDAFKSTFLLEALARRRSATTYIPIDISPHVVGELERTLPQRVPGLRVEGHVGEYLKMLGRTQDATPAHHRRLVLFLGSSLGNMGLPESLAFLKELRQMLRPGDLLLLGLDLVKEPELILAAYNDAEGFTRAFNQNLLTRINRELGGDFRTGRFGHYPVYDVKAHTCKSYLVSLMRQEVHVAGHTFIFGEQETIHTEVSQKYDRATIRHLQEQSGFTLVQHFHDARGWFTDTLWQA